MGTESLAYRTVQRQVENYNRESNDLMQAHQEAMDCRDCEAFLQLGIDAIQRIVRADRVIRKAIYDGVMEYDAKIDDGIRRSCQAWLSPCQFAEKWIIEQQARGHQIANVDDFRECSEEMRAIVEAQNQREGEPLPAAIMELRDKAIDEQVNSETSEFV
ncbi:MAG TPA: hypothetical protein VGY55_01330 [Pirellulales bacterium]|jgi:hypothetical protein|nr:hypothetical protein [Pirellulales bacterium]